VNILLTEAECRVLGSNQVPDPVDDQLEDLLDIEAIAEIRKRR